MDANKEAERMSDAQEMIRTKLEFFGLDRTIGSITLEELHELAAMAIKDVSFLHEHRPDPKLIAVLESMEERFTGDQCAEYGLYAALRIAKGG